MTDLLVILVGLSVGLVPLVSREMIALLETMPPDAEVVLQRAPNVQSFARVSSVDPCFWSFQDQMAVGTEDEDLDPSYRSAVLLTPER